MLKHGWPWKYYAKWKSPVTKDHIIWFQDLYEMSRIGKYVETESKLAVCGSGERAREHEGQKQTAKEFLSKVVKML